MRIKTTREINARTHDGREFTATEGDVAEIDDEDTGMVGLAKVLILSGQAEHYGDAGTVDAEPAAVEPASEAAGEPHGEEDDGEPGDEEDEDA